MKKILILFFVILGLFFTSLKVHAKENINIAFTIDNNYSTFAMLAINSIMINNSSESDYSFFVIESDLSDQNKQKMEEFVAKRDAKIEFIDVDTSIIDHGYDFFASDQWNGRINSIALARILLPDLLPKSLSRIIYLDADIIVIKDLLQLWNANIDGYPVGMVEDPWTPSYDFINMKKPYYNSGVMVMDLNFWRQRNITKQLLDYIDKNIVRFIPNGNSLSYFNFPDQDLINVVLKGNIKKLPKYFNSSRQYWYDYGTDTATIIHFVGHGKPWIYFEDGPAYKVYYNYWKNSELKPYYYYYKFYKKWGTIFRDMFVSFKNPTPMLFLKVLFIPIFIILETVFFLLPITIPLLLIVFGLAFIKKDFQKYTKWFQTLFVLINIGMFSYFLEHFRMNVYGLHWKGYFALIFSVFVFFYINAFIYYFGKENRQKYFVLLLLFMIIHFIYTMVQIFT